MQIQIIKVIRRTYAAQSGKHALGGDSRNDIIRRALFDAPLKEQKVLSAEEQEQERIIEKAWAVYTAQRKREHQEKLNIKYKRMVEAATALKELSPKLFEASQKQSISLIYPKMIKLPTETPANVCWNYEAVSKKMKLKAEAAAKKGKKTLR